MTLIGGLLAAQRYSRRRDPAGERWLWVWKSRVGGWMRRLAGLGLGRSHAEALAASGRNERAIVNTVERMFQELPQGVQRALADLPEDLRRIEVQDGGVADVDRGVGGEFG